MSKYLKLLLFLPILVSSTVQIKAVATRVSYKPAEIETKIKLLALMASGQVNPGGATDVYKNRLATLGLTFSPRSLGVGDFERACNQAISQVLQSLSAPEFENAYALRFLGRTQGSVGIIDMCHTMINRAESSTFPSNRMHLLIAKMAFLDFICLILDAAQIQTSKNIGWAAKKGLFDYQNGPNQIFDGFRQRDLNEVRFVLNRNGVNKTKYLYNCGLVSTFLFRNGPQSERGRYFFIDNELSECFANIITRRTSMAKTPPIQKSPTIVLSPSSLPSVPSSPNIFSPVSSRMSPGLSSTPRSNRSRSSSLPRTPQSFSYGPRMARPSSAPQLGFSQISPRATSQRRSASVRRPDANYQVHPSLLPRVGGTTQTGAGNYDIESLRARLNRLNEEAQLAGELKPLQDQVAQLKGQLEIPDSPVARQGQESFDDTDFDFEKEFEQIDQKFSALPSALNLRPAQSASSTSLTSPKKKSGFGRTIKNTAKRFNPTGLWSSSSSSSSSSRER